MSNKIYRADREFTNTKSRKFDNQEDFIDWQILRDSVLKRDNNKCQMCECTTKPLGIHHIKPRSEGGIDAMFNLIALCDSCHDIAEINQIPTANLIRNWPIEKEKAVRKRYDFPKLGEYIYEGKIMTFDKLWDIVQQFNPQLTEKLFRQRLKWEWWNVYLAVHTQPLYTETGLYI